MSRHAAEIARIRKAASLQEIREIADAFPAAASGEGGILYSGYVGDVSSEVIAKELAAKTGRPIINETPRARFLADPQVENAIKSSAKRILRSSGETPGAAKGAATAFLYGDASTPAGSFMSPEGCLWGKASKEFADSLRGDVTVVAAAAKADRVFARVELPAVLQSSNVAVLGSQPTIHLRSLEADGGIPAVLPAVQAQFVGAATKGIYTIPDHPGNTITQVAVSREVAAELQLDTARFTSSAYLRAAGFVSAPVELPAPTAMTQAAGPAVSEAAARTSLRPGALRGATVVTAAAVVYDLATSAHKASSLWEQGNHTGANSEVLHFGTRNLGMWGGAMLGVEVFGTAGAETGPWDLVVGSAGALLGAIAGDRLADAVDRARIFRQSGPDGRVWNYDPEHPERGWTRTTSELDAKAASLNDGFPVYRERSETADAALTDRLNYQASTTAVELALAHPPTPRDPDTQPAAPGDTRSVRDAPWNRDPQTHVWTRQVVHGLLEHGMANVQVERATQKRAAELDRAAQMTIAENATHSPQAIASRYEAGYRQYGWENYGPLPETVTTMLGMKAPGAATPARAEQPVVSPAPVPAHLLDFRQAGHPLHAFYEQALARVHDMEDRYRMPHGTHSEQLAAAVADAVAAHNVGKAPDRRFGTLERIDLRGEGADRQAIAVDRRVNYHLPQVHLGIPVDEALDRSVVQRSQDWLHRHMPHLYTAGRASEAAPAVPAEHAWPLNDLRNPDHPRHAQWAMLRAKAAEAYAHAGIPRGGVQLDGTAAVLLLHAKHGRLDANSTSVSLLADRRTGVIGPDSDLLLQQDHAALSLQTRIPSGELQGPPVLASRLISQTAQPGLPGPEPQQVPAR